MSTSDLLRWHRETLREMIERIEEKADERLGLRCDFWTGPCSCEDAIACKHTNELLVYDDHVSLVCSIKDIRVWRVQANAPLGHGEQVMALLRLAVQGSPKLSPFDDPEPWRVYWRKFLTCVLRLRDIRAKQIKEENLAFQASLFTD
jgi:hypothetical protein